MNSLIAAYLKSWWFPATRVGTAAVSLFIILGGIEMIDVTNIALPEDYVALTLAFCIGAAFFFATLLEQRNYEEAYENKGLTPEEYPKDRRYRVGTFIAILLGIAAGMVFGPMIVVNEFIGAGAWTFALVSAAVAAFAAPTIEYIAHCGLRVWLVKVRKTVTELAPEIKETGEVIIGSAGTLRRGDSAITDDLVFKKTDSVGTDNLVIRKEE